MTVRFSGFGLLCGCRQGYFFVSIDLFFGGCRHHMKQMSNNRVMSKGKRENIRVLQDLSLLLGDSLSPNSCIYV